MCRVKVVEEYSRAVEGGRLLANEFNVERHGGSLG
jgi:hypothetical protein